MTVQDAVVATINDASKRGHVLKALAQDTRISGSRLYEIYEYRKRLWAEEIPALVLATRNPLIVATIARACGGTFVPLPSSPTTLQSDLAAASSAMREFAETMQAFTAAIADGRVTDDDAEQVSEQGHQAITAILALIAHAERRASMHPSLAVEARAR